MLPLAYFGIESNAFTTAVDLLIVIGAVVYLSLVYWTYADARRRIVDPLLIGCATAASLFPFVGTLVYIILRPPEYLEDVQERELEIQAAEARLNGLERSLCPHCDYPIERDFVRCPSCLRKLKERCVSCSKPLDRAWTICPYCETEVPPEAPPRRRSRRPSRAADASAGGEELTMTTSEERPTVAGPEPASRRPARAPVARARPSAGPSEDLV
jgi:Double zinc ribbon